MRRRWTALGDIVVERDLPDDCYHVVTVILRHTIERITAMCGARRRDVFGHPRRPTELELDYFIAELARLALEDEERARRELSEPPLEYCTDAEPRHQHPAVRTLLPREPGP